MSELPSSEGLDPYPATDAPNPTTLSAAKSPFSAKLSLLWIRPGDQADAVEVADFPRVSVCEELKALFIIGTPNYRCSSRADTFDNSLPHTLTHPFR